MSEDDNYTEKKLEDSDTTSGDTTTSDDVRFVYSNDVLAGVVIALHSTIMLSSIFTNFSAPDLYVWVQAVLVVSVAVWLFGADVVKTYTNLRGK